MSVCSGQNLQEEGVHSRTICDNYGKYQETFNEIIDRRHEFNSQFEIISLKLMLGRNVT